MTTDICYIASRPHVNNFLWYLSVVTLLLNLFGPALILVLGQTFNTMIHAFVFKSQIFNVSEFLGDLKEMIKLSHSFVFKNILDENIPKKKAIFRTSFLIHIAFETVPQMILQSVTNQKYHIWFEPLAMLSLGSSLLMLIMTFIVVVKTDKYYL